MKKSKMVVTLALLASVGLVGCQKNDTAKINELQKSIKGACWQKSVRSLR